MVILAFYKARGGFVDRAIRMVTRSPYSHVELIVDPDDTDDDGGCRCYSSSARDGGVRSKSIVLRDDHWDLLEVAWHSADVVDIFARHQGSPYDYVGIIFSQFFNWRRHDQKRWFCSEITARALGIPNPESLSPGGLKAIVEKINLVHSQANRKVSANKASARKVSTKKASAKKRKTPKK